MTALTFESENIGRYKKYKKIYKLVSDNTETLHKGNSIIEYDEKK